MLYLTLFKIAADFLSIAKFSEYLTTSSSSTYLHEKGFAFPAILPKLLILQTRYEEISSFFTDILSSAKVYYNRKAYSDRLLL